MAFGWRRSLRRVKSNTSGVNSTSVLHSLPASMPAMSTTTIRLEDDLKVRVAAAAEREGKTAHAFILHAIAETVEQAELDEEFQRVAEGRWTKLIETGKTVPWDDAKAYLKARAVGGRARKPAARKLRP